MKVLRDKPWNAVEARAAWFSPGTVSHTGRCSWRDHDARADRMVEFENYSSDNDVTAFAVCQECYNSVGFVATMQRDPEWDLPYVPYNYCAHGRDLRIHCSECATFRIHGR